MSSVLRVTSRCRSRAKVSSTHSGARLPGVIARLPTNSDTSFLFAPFAHVQLREWYLRPKTVGLKDEDWWTADPAAAGFAVPGLKPRIGASIGALEFSYHDAPQEVGHCRPSYFFVYLTFIVM